MLYVSLSCSQEIPNAEQPFIKQERDSSDKDRENIEKQGDNSQATVPDSSSGGSGDNTKGTDSVENNVHSEEFALKGGNTHDIDSLKEDNSLKGENKEESPKSEDVTVANDKGDNCNINTANETETVTCVPVLTYLDEACSRWRINNFGLTLKQTNHGASLFRKMWDQAESNGKQRICRILKDIEEGKIVTRAESTKEVLDDSMAS